MENASIENVSMKLQLAWLEYASTENISTIHRFKYRPISLWKL